MHVPTILLVDDVRLFLEMEKGYLAPSRVRILTAQDGRAALALVREERPDLIIMDQHMPVMDGLTCCAAIKANPELRTIPVIILSNEASADMMVAFRRAGCDDYLGKPLDGRLFLDTVRRFVPSIERRTVRIPCRLPVAVRLEGGELLGMSEDLSLRGIYVACPARVAKGSPITLSFTLPGSEGRTVVLGRVAWLNSPEDRPRPAMPPGFGVEFVSIAGEGLALLREQELRAFVDAHRPPS
jgi:CheY-like chemotaxis protein/Tfp pilus assembly protein PilZ